MPSGKASVPTAKNPAELKSALAFGAIYALVLLASAAARQRFGSAGLFVVAGLSGLADMDAVTVSVSRQMAGQSIDPNEGWRMLLVGSLANFVFEAAVAAILGSKRFALQVAAFSVISMAGGLALVWLWPMGH